MNEHEKIFTLETLIKDLIDFNNKTFFKLYALLTKKCEKQNDKVKDIFRHKKRC